jgi:predicted Zn-dependent protease
MKKWVLAGSAFAILMAQGLSAQSISKPAPVSVPQSMSAKDKATGAKAHPELLAEFGGLYDGPQAAYVTMVGRKIASESGLANQPTEFTISLLNSPVNNAFAIPGGYVYVTRQLMALMNSEAELASVLGHEVGHVAARHSQKRSDRATRAGLGAVLATVLGGVLLGGDGAKALTTAWMTTWKSSTCAWVTFTSKSGCLKKGQPLCSGWPFLLGASSLCSLVLLRGKPSHIQSRQSHQSEQGGGEQTADHHNRQRPLGFRANVMRHRHGQ